MAITKVTTGGITDATIATADIADDAVTNAKIADGAVGGNQLGGNAVTAAKIGANEVTSAAIAAGAVGTAKLSDQCVTLDKLPHGTSSNDGKFLRANNGADPTFETVTGTTINNNGSNRIITGSSTANTLEGESTFTYDGVNIAQIDTSQTYAVLKLDGNAGGVIEFNEQGNRRFELYGVDAGLEIFDRDKSAYHSKFLSGGDFEISDGDLKFASGHGIDFSLTAEGTGSSNQSEIFHDYEEGTWTGAIETGSANIGGEWYIKIGGYVVGGGNITAIGNTSSSNLIRVTGLPFSNSGGGSAPGAVAGSKISVMDRACMSQVSGSSIYFLQSSTSSGSWDYIKHQHVNQSSGSITFAFHYYCVS